MITRTEKQIAAVFAVLVALAAIAWFTVEPAYGGQEKVTICHATSSETNPFVTLTIAAPAVYGPAGHFNENGTTQAGHEQDYFGACEETEEPPFDACPDIPGNQEQGTDCDPVIPPPTDPPGERCPPGMTPTAGKDGEEGNDECEFPETPTTPEQPEQPDHPHIPTCEQVPTICPATPEAPASPESPSPSAPEAPAAPSVDQPTLEKELDKQAKKNGATSSPGNLTPATDALPYTGLPLGIIAGIGGGTALLGAGLRGDLSRLRRRFGR